MIDRVNVGAILAHVQKKYEFVQIDSYTLFVESVIHLKNAIESGRVSESILCESLRTGLRRGYENDVRVVFSAMAMSRKFDNFIKMYSIESKKGVVALMYGVESYMKERGYMPIVDARENAYLASLFTDAKCTSVVDFGCHFGGLGYHVKKINDKIKMVGVDIFDSKSDFKKYYDLLSYGNGLSEEFDVLKGASGEIGLYMNGICVQNEQSCVIKFLERMPRNNILIVANMIDKDNAFRAEKNYPTTKLYDVEEVVSSLRGLGFVVNHFLIKAASRVWLMASDKDLTLEWKEFEKSMVSQ